MEPRPRLATDCRRFRPAIIALVLLSLAFGAAWPGKAAARMSSGAEAAKIDALLGYIERGRYIFLHDGVAETPAAARAYFERQLQASTDDVQTAREFIDSIASRSATGQPYRVLLPGGWQLSVREWLLYRLPIIEAELAP
jgi:hypothetical protein